MAGRIEERNAEPCRSAENFLKVVRSGISAERPNIGHFSSECFDLRTQNNPPCGNRKNGTCKHIANELGKIAEAAKPEPETIAKGSGRTNGKILIADDNKTNARLVELTLKYKMNGNAMEVRTAENGEIALRMLREAKEQGEPYSILILDIMMPVKDGYRVINEMLEEPGLVGTKIVVLTAQLQADVEKRIGNGIKVIQIPCSSERLMDAVFGEN